MEESVGVSLLANVARRVDIIEDRAEPNNVAACLQLLAGINFEKSLINLYLREEAMRESVVYQSIGCGKANSRDWNEV